MDILSEIIEIADNIIYDLKKSGFFEQHVFCKPFELRREFEIQMQRNWEQYEDFYLSDEQAMEIIKKTSINGINAVFNDMVMKGILVMHSVDVNGELLYKLNSEINIDDL